MTASLTPSSNEGYINEKPLAATSHIDHVHTSDKEGSIQKTPSVDTIHNDEALRVLAAEHGSDEWDPAEEKRLLRKLDWKLLPLLCFTYGLQYYDKAMLGQAVR
jgi:hypothetical protein